MNKKQTLEAKLLTIRQRKVDEIVEDQMYCCAKSKKIQKMNPSIKSYCLINPDRHAHYILNETYANQKQIDKMWKRYNAFYKALMEGEGE